MSSLVLEFQQDIRRSRQSVTELLRTAKLISAKLGLSDISEWLDSELSGYKAGQEIPEYRVIRGGTLQVLNPYHGWQRAGEVRNFVIRTDQPISELEDISKGEFLTVTPSPPLPVRSIVGSDEIAQRFHQRIVNPPVVVKTILEAVKNRLLDWSIELEQRGILGKNMSFNPEEKKSAQKQVFNIQQMNGVIGSLSGSNVQIYNYSSLHQTVKDAGISKEQRNELEDIMDQLKEAEPGKKRTLMAKAKAWLVNNEEVLGAAASIVRKALGIGEDA